MKQDFPVHILCFISKVRYEICICIFKYNIRLYISLNIIFTTSYLLSLLDKYVIVCVKYFS